jgi:hypothetical protein
MKTNAADLIRMVSNVSVVIPVLLFVLKARALPRENVIIGVCVIMSGLTDFLGYRLLINHVNTAIVFNGYCFISFSLLCWYYYEVVFKFKNRGYFYFGIAVYVLSLYITSSQQSIENYQGPMWAITGAILVFFGIIYNNYQVEKPPLFDKNLYSGLIFNAAIMLYFSFNFFLFVIANYVLTELPPDTGRMTWAFHNVNNIIKNVAFAFGLYYTGRRRVNLTDEEVERIQWRRLE